MYNVRTSLQYFQHDECHIDCVILWSLSIIEQWKNPYHYHLMVQWLHNNNGNDDSSLCDIIMGMSCFYNFGFKHLKMHQYCPTFVYWNLLLQPHLVLSCMYNLRSQSYGHHASFESNQQYDFDNDGHCFK